MIVTDKIDLQENETVVKRGDRVGFGKKGPDNGELILTNIALIYVKKNLFGKQKEVLRLPLRLQDCRFPISGLLMASLRSRPAILISLLR